MQRGVKINSLRLKEARLFRQMTILELAEKVNINKQAISQFENSKYIEISILLFYRNR